MADSIGDWLNEIGLGKYTETFADNDIDLEILPDLSNDDLKEVGLSLGHRKRLLRAIADLTPVDVSGSATMGAPLARESVPQEVERRQLTVMFVDLVGSTELSGRLDPEDLRTLMQRYQSAVAEVIETNSGYLANWLGDGVLAYFGWPNSREDQAVQAVRAGLDAVAAVSRLPLAESSREMLAARVGIATGQVVVGDLEAGAVGPENMVTGETPNLAARLQGIAEPGCVVIGPTTRAIVGGVFDLNYLGPQALKGFGGRVEAWGVQAEHAVESRFDAPDRRLTAFTGRTHEVGLLMDRWNQARSGEGQVVLISGEAGIGKSRIVSAFRDRIKSDRHRRLLYQCSPHHVNSALYPPTRQLEHDAGIAAGETAEAKLDRLEAFLRQMTTDFADDLPLIAALLSIPFEARYGASEMTAEQERMATLRALRNQLFSLARDEPALFVLEDAHWIDPTTQELIGEIVPRLTDRPVLMLITHRPEWVSPFQGLGHVTALNLSRLSRAQMATMVRDVAGRALTDEVIARIVRRTDGVPLFVEELTKAMAEVGFDTTDADVPVTLQASLMARLDRLGPAKEIAQIGAVIGREFGRDLIARVADREIDLDAGLDRLVGAQLIFRTHDDEDDTYVFKHALIQDVAHESLLRQRRQVLHLAIAAALLKDGGSGTSPEVLAQHYESGGDFERSFEWWERAGDAAAARSAQPEAAAHYASALRVMRGQQVSDDEARECRLLLRLGQAQVGAFGAGFPATMETFDRAAALAGSIAVPELRMLAQYGQFQSQIIAGNYEKAGAIADDMAKFAEQHGEAWMRAVPARPQASALYQMGDLRSAQAILDPIVDHVEALSAELPTGFAQDPLLLSPAMLAHIEWALGEQEGAFERSSRLVEEIARQTSNPNTISAVFIYDMYLSAFARNAERTRDGATRVQDHTQRTGGIYWAVAGEIGFGIVDVLEGRPESGIAKLTNAVDRYVASGAGQFLSFHLLYLAEAYHLIGEPSEALRILEEVRERVESTKQHFYEPELYRLNGVVLGGIGREAEAAAAFKNAIAIADRQGNVPWRDRATEGLESLGLET